MVRVICSLSGIKDISSKLLSRSRNKLNIAQATIEALKKLKVKLFGMTNNKCLMSNKMPNVK